MEFLVGLDFRTTEPRAMKALKEISDEMPMLKCFCYSDPSTDDTPVFHPKIYLLNQGAKATIVIGSSNLTKGGLKNNAEVNVLIETGIADELVSDIYSIYHKLKFQHTRFEPDIEFIETYDEAYKRIQRKQREALKEKSTQNIISELKERERILPRPRISENDLFGWQKLVYEKLPSGAFRTSDIYDFENEFAQHYPENKNIRAKIRQILQQLRDLGLIRDLGREKWDRS